MKKDISGIVNKALYVVANHEIEGRPGAYRRWNSQNADGTRELGVNEYGCADAANILYMLGAFPSDDAARHCRVEALQAMQNPDTGMFVEATHHTIHTTAHCIAALELFDAKAVHPLTELEYLRDKEALESFLASLNWAGDPWMMSHRGAGLYAAMVLQGEVDRQWQGWYFDWLYENADPETGFWLKGAPQQRKVPLFHHLAGSFHYLFNHEYAHMPLRYPDKMIDTCLQIYHDIKNTAPAAGAAHYNNRYEHLGRSVSFAEIDWVYCITRAGQQTDHRRDECFDTLREFAEGYVDYLDSLDADADDDLNDLHQLFGATCALAELQRSLRGELISERPLKLVLDRRPFI